MIHHQQLTGHAATKKQSFSSHNPLTTDKNFPLPPEERFSFSLPDVVNLATRRPFFFVRAAFLPGLF